MSECYPIVNIWCKYQPFEPTIMRLFEFDGWGNIPFTTFLFCFLFSVHYITFFPLSNLSFFLLIFFSVPTSVSVIYIYIYIYIFLFTSCSFFCCFVFFCFVLCLHFTFIYYFFYFTFSFLFYPFLGCLAFLLCSCLLFWLM